DPACGRVLVIDQDGWVTVAVDAADLAVGASGPDAAVAVAVGPDDRLHQATDGNRILVRGGDGALIHIGGDGGGTSDGAGGPATAAGFFVEDLAVAPDGTVYVAEPPADRVRAIGPDGIVHTAAGPTGERAFCCFSAVSNGSFGQLAAASGDGEDGAVAFGDIFEGLGGIGLSPAGELVIAEHGRDRVLRIVEV